jgi:hypothetical protein
MPKELDWEVFVLSKKDFDVEFVVSESYLAVFRENINYDWIIINFTNENNISKVVLLSYICELNGIN